MIRVHRRHLTFGIILSMAASLFLILVAVGQADRNLGNIFRGGSLLAFNLGFILSDLKEAASREVPFHGKLGRWLRAISWISALIALWVIFHSCLRYAGVAA